MDNVKMLLGVNGIDLSDLAIAADHDAEQAFEAFETLAREKGGEIGEVKAAHRHYCNMRNLAEAVTTLVADAKKG